MMQRTKKTELALREMVQLVTIPLELLAGSGKGIGISISDSIDNIVRSPVDDTDVMECRFLTYREFPWQGTRVPVECLNEMH